MEPTARGLEPRTAADTADDASLAAVSATLAKLEANGSVNFIARVLANSPNCFRPFIHMSDGLLNRSGLPGEVREIVILVLAHEGQCAYEWWEHESMSAAAGVSQAQRDAIAGGDHTDAELFDDDQRIAAAFASSLRSSGTIDDEAWESARTRWGDAGALDLVLTVAWWGAFVPTVIGALQLDDLVSSLSGSG